jgi:hypothetical protein
MRLKQRYNNAGKAQSKFVDARYILPAARPLKVRASTMQAELKASKAPWHQVKNNQ